MRPYRYRFGGLEVGSTFPLPGLLSSPSSSAPPALVLDRSDEPPPTGGRVVFRWLGQYGLTLRAHRSGWLMSTTHVAAVIADGGRSVRCHPDEASPDWCDVLVRRILPRVAQLHGRIALHAASVACDGWAILLIGSPHAGKSTLAAALCRSGPWRLLGDDIALIDGDSSPPVAWSVGSRLGLWPDSLSHFVPSFEPGDAAAGHTAKRWLDGGADPPAAARLDAMVVLTGDDTATIELVRLGASEAARRAGARIVCFDPSDQELLTRSWSAVGRLAHELPAFSLSYPRDFDRLAALTSVLSAQLNERARART